MKGQFEELFDEVQVGVDEFRVRITGDDRIHVIHVPIGLSSTARDAYVKDAIRSLIRRYCDDLFLEKVKFHDLLDSVTKKLGNTEDRTSPPVVAELLISFLAPASSAQAFLGDLQEMFRKNTARFGEKQARRKYWLQIAPLIWQSIKRLGFLAVLVDYFRSKLGF